MQRKEVKQVTWMAFEQRFDIARSASLGVLLLLLLVRLEDRLADGKAEEG